MVQYKANYSRSILFQLVLLSVITAFLLMLNLNFLKEVYFTNQVTNTGYIINSAILGLFAFGLIKLISLLLRYMREENALTRFLKNVENEVTIPTEHINIKSLIYNRYASVLEISKHNVAVNHSALASTLMATENTHLSLPRFINNILILTGVFGTIVSLSIALFGASKIIDSANGIGGMNLVIHGMSTALSTTGTAIVCYMFFGYFYMKLTDVQTELLSGIEQATTLYIMPRFTYQTDSMLHEIGSLVKALHTAAQTMSQTQIDFTETGRNLNAITGTYADQQKRMSTDIEEIKTLLRHGFRLSE